MRTSKRYLITGLSIALMACGTGNREVGATQGHPSQIVKAHWLLGSWQGTAGEATFSEYWEMRNDSVLYGRGYAVVGKDTVSAETICLVQRGGRLFYEPTVSGQNGGRAVSFENTELNDSGMVFKNPAHDFPQTISYRRIGPDSVLASISGKLHGKESRQFFPMRRQ